MFIRIVTIQRMLAENKRTVTSGEVQQYYSENQDKFKGKSLDESEEEIRKTLASEKDGSFFETYFEDLKKTSGLQVNYDVLEVNTPTKEEISDYYEQNKEKYQTSASRRAIFICSTVSSIFFSVIFPFPYISIPPTFLHFLQLQQITSHNY